MVYATGIIFCAVACVVLVPLATVPLAREVGAVKVTTTPVSGTLLASVTVTLSGVPNGEDKPADCGVVPVSPQSSGPVPKS